MTVRLTGEAEENNWVLLYTRKHERGQHVLPPKHSQGPHMIPVSFAWEMESCHVLMCLERAGAIFDLQSAL